MVRQVNFSSKFHTYNDWLSRFHGSDSYRHRIERLHARYPKASLSQIRGHANKRKPISKLRVRVDKLSWTALKKQEAITRKSALKVLSNMRNNGLSLTTACKEAHTTKETVLKSIKSAFKKERGKWIPKQIDHISRSISIYETCKQVYVTVNDSQIASLLGAYNNAVMQYLTYGNATLIMNDIFKKPFVDENNVTHTLDTDLTCLDQLQANNETEFYEIYAEA